MHPFHKHRESERKTGHERYRACGGRMAEGGPVKPPLSPTPDFNATKPTGPADDPWNMAAARGVSHDAVQMVRGNVTKYKGD